MNLLPDGVYVGLSEEAYFAQKRLGSTDLKELYKTPVNWWYASGYNPNKKPKPWKYQNDRDFGHGFHYLLLEGEEESGGVNLPPFFSAAATAFS